MIEQLTKKGKSVIIFSGDLSITHATEFQQQLLKAATTVSHVRVKVAEVDNVDLSFLQLLLSWAQSMKKSGKKLTFDFQLNEEFTRIIEESGFMAAFGEL